MPLVYVADDEPGVREVVGEALRRDGFEVVLAEDGAALLEHAARRAPDLVLLDMAMPGLTGWDVRRRLREEPSTAEVPVVAVTAQGGPGVEASARSLGFAGYLRKPFRLAVLLQVARSALHHRPA